MARTTVPNEVITGITAVRNSGLTNMLDRPTVAHLAAEMGHDEAARWITAYPREYAEGIFCGFAEDEEE